MSKARLRAGSCAAMLLCLAALPVTALAAAAGSAASGATRIGARTAEDGAPSAGARLAAIWSDLWWTRDQQGERLLQADHPQQAAEHFRDPRLRAYAELAAGQDAQAARLLAPYKDPRSLYNFGNALAHTGQLQQALKAYDATLEAAPHDRDARHNRDLVARALQRQQRPPAAGSQNAPSSRGSQGAQSSQSSQSSHGAKSSHGSRGSNGSQGPHGSQSPQGSQSSQGARGSSGSQTPHGSAASGASGPQQHPSAASHLGGQSGQPQDTQLARAGAARGGLDHPPPSEQTLSLEQWLRRIPDDPGGLLRRKFLVEHLMRQQSGGSSDSSGATP